MRIVFFICIFIANRPCRSFCFSWCLFLCFPLVLSLSKFFGFCKYHFLHISPYSVQKRQFNQGKIRTKNDFFHSFPQLHKYIIHFIIYEQNSRPFSIDKMAYYFKTCTPLPIAKFAYYFKTTKIPLLWRGILSISSYLDFVVVFVLFLGLFRLILLLSLALGLFHRLVISFVS